MSGDGRDGSSEAADRHCRRPGGDHWGKTSRPDSGRTISLHPIPGGSKILACAPPGDASGPVSPQAGWAAVQNSYDGARLAFHEHSDRNLVRARKMTCTQVVGTAIEPPAGRLSAGSQRHLATSSVFNDIGARGTRESRNPRPGFPGSRKPAITRSKRPDGAQPVPQPEQCGQSVHAGSDLR